MKNRHNISLLIVTLLFAILISCGGEMENKKITYSSLKDIPDAAWENLSKKKIYFGHHSVGFNILHGIEDIINENNKINIKIKETYNPEEFEVGTISHSRIGYNTDPHSKLKSFEFYMNVGGAKTSDISTFKYCYVDFNRKTNVKEVFNEYKETINGLKNKFPDTVFIISTVPLTTIQSGYKATIKKVLGKTLGGFEENIKRNEFNNLLRNEFGKTDPIFDIAEIESTYPDGSRQSFQKDGNTYYSMIPGFTSDGGHLNEIGRKKVAEQFLLLLANL